MIIKLLFCEDALDEAIERMQSCQSPEEVK